VRGSKIISVAAIAFWFTLVAFDPVRGNPRRLRAGKDSAHGVAVLGLQCGVCCCSMYWRTMEIGAPPQLEAK